MSRWCLECYAEENRRRSQEVSEKYETWLVQWKMAQGCARCGYAEHPDALHIDHLNPGAADKFGGFKVARHWFHAAGRSLTTVQLQAELSKCQVLCANCHAIKNAEERKVHAVEWNALRRKKHDSTTLTSDQPSQPSLF